MKKRFFRSFTFHFLLASLLTIHIHYIGQDSHGIVLFELNPILNNLRYTHFAEAFIQPGPSIATGSLSGSISIYWYAAHLLSFGLYGFILDIIRLGFKR